MFKKGRARQATPQADPPSQSTRTQVNTIIGHSTIMSGDIHFSGVMKIDGIVNGNLTAEPSSILIINESGRVKGEVSVANMMVNGIIEGNVHAEEKVELFEKARILGDLHYSLLEMEVGSTVNGKLVNVDQQVVFTEQSPAHELPLMDMKKAPDISL